MENNYGKSIDLMENKLFSLNLYSKIALQGFGGGLFFFLAFYIRKHSYF